MKHSRLYDFLVKHHYIQLLLSILPSTFIIIFVFVYMVDLSNIWYSLSYNDKIVESGLQTGILSEVSDCKQTDKGKFDVLIEDRGIKNIDASFGDIILNIYFTNEDFFKVVLMDENNSVTFVEKFDFMKYKSKGIIEVDGKEIKPSDSLICSVILNEDNFSVIFNDEDETTLELAEFENVRQISETETGKKVSYSYEYSITLKNQDVNFALSLPTSNFYYDKDNYCVISNISKDFCWTFILGSKLLLVIFSMLILIVLFKIVGKNKDFIIFARTEPFVLNLISLGVLPLLALATIILFKC